MALTLRQYPLLGATPAIVLDLADLEFGTAGFVQRLAVKHEVQDEGMVHIGAAQVQTRSQHADFVTHLESAPSGKEIRLFAIALDLVGEGVVNDDRFAPRVDQALTAINLKTAVSR